MATKKKVVNAFELGDEVRLINNATYTTGGKIPAWILDSKLYIRDIDDNGNYTIARAQTGPVSGAVKGEFLIPYREGFIPSMEPVIVKLTKATKVFTTPGKGLTKLVLQPDQYFTVVDIQNDYGRLKSGDGWISLKDTKTIKL